MILTVKEAFHFSEIDKEIRSIFVLMPMTSSKITFYGGVNEIGGNKILIEDKKSDASFFIDFGMNFTRMGLYFEEFIQPRTCNGIVDFLTMGLIPQIDSVYRKDLLACAGMKVHDKPLVDALILSHAHLDHASHISFIDGDVPIYCSDITHAILKVLSEIENRSIDSEIIDFKTRPILNSKDKAINRIFNLGNKIKIHGVEVEMFPVDHSIPGACGMIIYASDKTIAYSGDLRLHGTDGYLTEQFIEKVKIAKPDIFLCEGTRIDNNEIHSENNVKINSNKAVSSTKGIVIADYAWKDTTRFNTFLEIAKENKRKFCISFREAYYIKELKKFIPDLPELNDPNILLYKRKLKTGTYRENDYEKDLRQFLTYENTVDANYVNKNQDQIIMELAYWHIQELVDVKPSSGSLYIKSASEAFTEEQIFDMKRLNRWLDFFHLRYENYHASGHAPAQDLKKVMEGSGAKVIVPIHTEHQDQFGPLIKNSIKIELPTPCY